MSDDNKKSTSVEVVTFLLSGLSGIGGALGAVFAALQYAPNYTVHILIVCLVVVSLIAFGLYIFLGSGSLTTKASSGLALAFATTLAALAIYRSDGGPRPSLPTPPMQHAIEIHASDASTLDPIDPNTVRNFKIVVVNNNDTRQRITPEEDVTKIDLSHIKFISITVCNVTTEYNVEAIKATERQVSLPITFFVNMRSGAGCVDRTR